MVAPIATLVTKDKELFQTLPLSSSDNAVTIATGGGTCRLTRAVARVRIWNFATILLLYRHRFSLFFRFSPPEIFGKKSRQIQFMKFLSEAPPPSDCRHHRRWPAAWSLAPPPPPPPPTIAAPNTFIKSMEFHCLCHLQNSWSKHFSTSFKVSTFSNNYIQE